MAYFFSLGSSTLRSAPGVSFVPNTPSFVAWADLNKDGYDDIVASGAFYPYMGSNWAPITGWVAFGQASGYRVATNSEFPASSLRTVHPREYAFADFNNDGRLDFFIADHGYDATPFPGYQNRLYLSNGNNSWQDATANLPQISDFTHSVSVGDVNRDGSLDILVGNYSVRDVRLLLGDGRGNFGSNTALLPTKAGQALDASSDKHLASSLLSDLDGDGYADLLLGMDTNLAFNQPASRIVWNDNGSVAAGNETVLPLPTTFGGKQALYDAQTTDINLDGLPDLLINYQGDVNQGGWELQVLINKGNHQFEDQTQQWFTDTSVITSGALTQSSSAPWFPFLRPRDLNNDGRMDFFIGGTLEKNGKPVANYPLMLIQQPDGKLAPIVFGDLKAQGAPDFMMYNMEFVQRGTAGAGELVSMFYDNGVPQFNSVPIQFTPASQWRPGTANNDTLTGTSGEDMFCGYAGNDVIIGNAGNDSIDGGAGIDVARINVNRSQATLVKTSSGWTLGSGTDGNDSLINIERVQFADTYVALDLDGNAGKVAKTIGALFGKDGLANKGYVGLGLSLLDKGITYDALVALAVNSAPFTQLAGGKSNPQFVDLVYRNLIGTAPTEAARSHYVDLLDRGVFSQASLALVAADTGFNTQQIDLVGLSSAGLAYTPMG